MISHLDILRHMYNNLISHENKWILYSFIWRIILKSIILTSDTLPVLSGCNFCLTPEPFYHPDRIVDFHILFYVVSGCIYVTEDDTDYEVHEGELLFLHSGMHHYGKKPMPKGTSWYYVHFYLPNKSESYANIQNAYLPSPNEPFRFQMELPKHVMGLAQSRIVSMLAGLADDLHSGNAAANLTNHVTDYQINDPSVIWNVNIRLFSILTELASVRPASTPVQSLSDRIAAYLAGHTASNFSAELLEKQFYLSYKHMAAVFKKDKQMTLLQYHTRARMTEACRLLRTTMNTIGEISETLGYHDMLYFSRCFHQTIGVSPSEYRRQTMGEY